MFLLNFPAAVVTLGLFFFLDDLTGFEITYLLELPEPFSFIFTWFAALPVILWLSQAITKLIVRDFLILKGTCPNCGAKNLSFFGTILSVSSGGTSNTDVETDVSSLVDNFFRFPVAAAQKQKALLQRVETDFPSLVDNFTTLVNVSRVQAADSLLKLVSELKQTAIFSGLASLNDHVEQRLCEFNKLAEKTDTTLGRVGEEAAASLKELESHLYTSAEKASQPSLP